MPDVPTRPRPASIDEAAADLAPEAARLARDEVIDERARHRLAMERRRFERAVRALSKAEVRQLLSLLDEDLCAVLLVLEVRR